MIIELFGISGQFFFIGAVLVLQNNTFGGKIQARKEHMFGKGKRKNYFLKPIDKG